MCLILQTNRQNISINLLNQVDGKKEKKLHLTSAKNTTKGCNEVLISLNLTDLKHSITNIDCRKCQECKIPLNLYMKIISL